MIQSTFYSFVHFEASCINSMKPNIQVFENHIKEKYSTNIIQGPMGVNISYPKSITSQLSWP
jgi:hypothetical protein